MKLLGSLASGIVIELQLIAPPGPSSGNKVNGASDPLPMFAVITIGSIMLWALH
jgi:hypothetical protein